MATYEQLFSEVAFRVNRPNLTQIARRFCQSRIRYFATFLFTGTNVIIKDNSVVCTPGNPFVSLPPGMQSVLYLRFLLGNIWLPIWREPSYFSILDLDVLEPPLASLPAIWATWGDAIRMFPAPVNAFQLELTGESIAGTPAPVLPTDSNFWTDDTNGGAYNLILFSACEEMLRQYIKDERGADRFKGYMDTEFSAQIRRTFDKAGPVMIRPYFGM